MSVLQQLEELREEGSLPTAVPSTAAGGFLIAMQSLNDLLSHYEMLLSELAEAIAGYDAMYRYIRSDVVVPAVRQLRKQTDKRQQTSALESEKFAAGKPLSFLLNEHLAAIQGF